MNKVLFAASFALLALFSACSKKPNAEGPKSLKVYCDQAIYDLMLEPCMKFDSTGAETVVIVKKVSAHEAMAGVLSGEADVSLVARDYTRREDSLMKANNVPPRTRKVLANDALVFYASDRFPIDTINADQMKDILTGRSVPTDFFSKIPYGTEIVLTNELSSEYENAKSLIAKQPKLPAANKVIFSSKDSAIAYVKAGDNRIGLGYLSQVTFEIGLKTLAVGFTDTNGTYFYPREVHQANVLQRLYPFVVDHFIYVLDPANETAMSFLRYMRSPRGEVQRYFKDKGIVPAVGDIRLIPNE